MEQLIENNSQFDSFLKVSNRVNILHNSRFGNCNESFSDFSVRIYLFAVARSLIFASGTDTLIFDFPKLMSGLVSLNVQFSCPARPFNY